MESTQPVGLGQKQTPLQKAKNENRGWLKTKERNKRKENVNTFTEEHCTSLLKMIDTIQYYIGCGNPSISTSNSTVDSFIRLRDKSLIILETLFFKRGTEVLRLKRKDIQQKVNHLEIFFSINKKRKRMRKCPNCNEINGVRKILFCKKCGTNISTSPITVIEMGQERKAKKLPLSNRFSKIILVYLNMYDRMSKGEVEDNNECYLFPPYRVLFGQEAEIQWNGRPYHKQRKGNITKTILQSPQKEHETRPLSTYQFDKILQRLDPSLTSCLFRYGGAERLLKAGFTSRELKDLGDWESERMPLIYAERVGETEAERKYTDLLSRR